MQVFVWHFSLIFWSDYFNQSCLKMPLAHFFRNRNRFSEMAHFFRHQPFPSEWDILLNLTEKALSLVPLGSSCFLRIGWYSGLYTTWKGTFYTVSFLSCQKIVFLLYRKIARCKSSKYYESVLPAGTSVDFIFENYGPSSCTFLTIGTDLTEVNLEY